MSSDDPDYKGKNRFLSRSRSRLRGPANRLPAWWKMLRLNPIRNDPFKDAQEEDEAEQPNEQFYGEMGWPPVSSEQGALTVGGDGALCVGDREHAFAREVGDSPQR
jgi:hypothetical protein